jgi:alpha-glucosidase
MYRKICIYLACLFYSAICLDCEALSSTPIVIKSPDNHVSLVVYNDNGQLKYSVSYNSKTIIGLSVLGITINGSFVGQNAIIEKVTRRQVKEKYDYRGVHSKVFNQFTDTRIVFSAPVAFEFHARVYNDGVAFRYVIDNRDSAVVEDDNTCFTLPPGSICWLQSNTKYYEGRYGKSIIDTMKKGALVGPPITIELPGGAGYAAITEGGLTDFAGMSLVVSSERTLKANLSGVTKKKEIIETPWRIIEIGKDLNMLVNCEIISSVSPKYDAKLFPKGYNTDWIKPGRGVWTWLAERGPVTLENLKKFTDMAAQLGFEYNLVDEGWGNWKDSINKRDNWDMLKELVDYSAAKGVKIWVWKAYPNRKGIPGIKDRGQRKIFFERCKAIGIVGLKIDFFDSEAQEIIQFYQAALKDAAESELMIDFHGSNKPTGETRTWPNEMTREGVRGLESRPPYAFTNTIIPFSRYLAGHGDFTPLHFGNRLGETSWAHQVASMIIFTSPFLCLGADPQTILDNPCKEMIQSIPPVWDETIVLPQSKIGELALFARRKGDTWFVAAMNGSDESKVITADLSFMKGNYRVSTVYDDSTTQKNALIETGVFKSNTSLTITINKNGGYAGRFEKIK